ncbi:MAG: DUF2867 domain-containing protein [Candidatus Promineifilaceae bacterium]
MINPVVTQIPAMQTLMQDADHVDVKTFHGQASMRGFIASMFSYYPSWLKGLYGVRAIFVRFLGMKQEGMPHATRLEEDGIPLTAGEQMAFFKVEQAEDEHYWIASAKEAHLDAYLAVVVEGDISAERTFHLVTIVHYNNWAGPVYFNIIRPFHHLVVQAMGRAALRNLQRPAYV